MRPTVVGWGFFALGLALLVPLFGTFAAVPVALPASGGGLAVAELFTSEGCSSCPPADALLAELAARPEAADGRLVLLAWHVDYWDQLGWTDPYALAVAGRRQQAYASVLAGRPGVYTPELVVNGVEAMVGSDRGRVAAALGAALEGTRGGGDPVIGPVTQGGGVVRARVAFPGAPAGATYVAVLVEDDLTSSVRSGENRGRSLPHTRVVRAAAFGDASSRGVDVALTAPDGVVMDHASLLVLTQASGLGAMVGAASVGLGG